MFDQVLVLGVSEDHAVSLKPEPDLKSRASSHRLGAARGSMTETVCLAAETQLGRRKPSGDPASLPSIRDGYGPSNRGWIADCADHGGSEVGAGEVPGPRKATANGRSAFAGQRPVREPRRTVHSPFTLTG